MKVEQTQEQQPPSEQQRSTLRGSGQDHRVAATQHEEADQGIPPIQNQECAGYRTHLMQLRRDAPCRPPNWRHQLAVEISRHPDPRVVKRLRGWADDWVVKWLEHDKRHLAPEHPLTQARDLVKPARMRQRIEVEARLLAGQSSAAIADKTGIPADTVDWYHFGFFDCRDRLHVRGYVVHHLLGSSPPVGIGNSPPIEMLPWYGFFLGPAAIALLLDVFRFWEADRQPTRGMTAAQLSQRALRLTARASIEARMLPVSQLGAADLRTLLAMAERGNRNQVIR